VPVEPVGLAGDQVALADQFADPLDHSTALEPLDLEPESARQDRLGREGRFALGEVPDRRGGRVLGLDRFGRQEERCRAAHCKRARRTQRRIDPGGDFADRRRGCLAKCGPGLHFGPCLGFGHQCFAIEPKFGGALLPAFDKRAAILGDQFGIAGVERDLLFGREAGGAGFGDLGLDLVGGSRRP
jgi:hypothetical protein